MRWFVPDMPARLRDQIRHEMYVTKEIIIAEEAKRALETATSHDTVRNLKNLIARADRLSKTVTNKNNNNNLKEGEDGTDDTDDCEDSNNDKQNHTRRRHRMSEQKFTKEQIQDAVLVHKPDNIGEITEVTV